MITLPDCPFPNIEYQAQARSADAEYAPEFLRLIENNTSSSNVAGSQAHVEFIYLNKDRFDSANLGRVFGVAENEDTEKDFKRLAKKWRDETGSSSLTMRRYADSSYQSILVLGGRDKTVVKLILQELKTQPDMWFEALRRLTNEDPAKGEKTFDGAVKAWLKWGKDKTLIS